MYEKKVLRIIGAFSAKLPHFPDGRIDYTTSSAAPVAIIFVRYGGKVLLLKRGNAVSTYRGKWNTVAGYLDEVRPVREKVLEELREEIGVRENAIREIKFGRGHTFTDKSIGKTWIITTAVVALKSPKIKLDWEHTDYKWITAKEIGEFDIVPNLKRSLERAAGRAAAKKRKVKKSKPGKIKGANKK